MEIRVGVSRQIIVDCEIDALNVNTTTKDVGGNANALIELLKLLVPFDAVVC